MLTSCCWLQLVSSATSPKQLCPTSLRAPKLAGSGLLRGITPLSRWLLRTVYFEQAAAYSNLRSLHLCDFASETDRRQCQPCLPSIAPLAISMAHQVLAELIVADSNSKQQHQTCRRMFWWFCLLLLPSPNGMGKKVQHIAA